MVKYVKYINCNLFFRLFCEIDDLWKRRGAIDRSFRLLGWERKIKKCGEE